MNLRKEQQHKYYQEHKEKILLRNKEYNLKHKEQVRINRIKSRDRRKDHFKEYDKTYYLEHIEHKKEYGKNRPKRMYRDYARNYSLKKNYGIDIEIYNKMFLEQEGKCKLCHKHQEEFKKRFFVDHDHKTGKIRGLVCYKCNTFLGYVDNNPEIILNIINYLKVEESS